MHVLVTGCAGFIGSNLCHRLLKKGARVMGIDNLDPYYDIELKKKNLERLEQDESFHFTRGDIKNREVYPKLMEPKPEVVVHLAAMVGVRPSVDRPVEYVRNNVMGTLILLEQMTKNEVKKLVFSSSSSVYGDSCTPPFKEDDHNTWPISPYGMTKREGESFSRLYHKISGIEVNALRLFTVYGPGQRPDMALHKFCKKMMEGSSIDVYGRGETYRDYTYVDDIVQGFLLALEKINGYREINLGSGHVTKLSDMIELIASELDIEPEINYLPIPPGDMKRTYADISKAKRELGYSPKIKFEDGVKKEIVWLKGLYSG